MAVPPRHFTALHTPERLLAEYDRVHSAYPEKTRTRRPVSQNTSGDYRLARSDCPWLECAPNAFCLGRQASATSSARLCSPSSFGWFCGCYHPVHSLPYSFRPMAMRIANDPVVQMRSTALYSE